LIGDSNLIAREGRSACTDVRADSPSNELGRLLRSCRSYFVTAAAFSLAINLLYLSGPLYMIQIYDRVISSASVVTLVMLTVALLVAFAALAGLDAVRARVLTRASIRLDRRMAARVMSATVDDAVRSGSGHAQPLRDFDNFRQFATGGGIHAAFDLPWAPIYVLVIFMLHPGLGSFALGSAIVLIGMALVNEWSVRKPLTEANMASTRSYDFTDMSLRNAEVIHAMGMMDGLLQRWNRGRARVLERQAEASDRAATMASLIRFLRLFMQSAILGLGAYLVIERATTIGAMFAASILLGRAIQPVELIVGSWRSFVSAYDAYRRVRALLAAHPSRGPGFSLPRPAGHVSVENLSYATPGSSRAILRGVSFSISPAEILGIIGSSGAGKSTLARQLVGVLLPSAGSVRLDGAEVAAWSRAAFGRHVGYLPQDVELFADTVAANISRFDAGGDAKVVDAAQLAGVHEMILRLPGGYETQVGEGGAVLSGGYRQRIGLARAVYGSPSLVILDEPSSNLDIAGDEALRECVLELKNRRTTVVLISHRPSTLCVVDKILVMQNGMLDLFGPRDEVIAHLMRPVPASRAAAKQAASS
jgi:ATP-binding cassette, subfamily C, bacterial